MKEDNKKVLSFPQAKTQEPEPEKEIDVVPKDKIAFKISNKELIKSSTLQDNKKTQSIFINFSALHEKVKKDAPDFYVSNLLIKAKDQPLSYEEFPQSEEEVEKFKEHWDTQAKALIHALNYINIETLERFMEYMKTFESFYREFDANDKYPVDLNHDYFKFFNECKIAANKLKEDKNKKESE